MNFNREGDSHNDRKSSIYDLTRMEPRAYWPVNHLLMRIYDDGADDIRFEKAIRTSMHNGMSKTGLLNLKMKPST